MHDGLVGLLLEVAVPAGAEFWTRPLVHHVKFCLCRTNLDTGFNAVSSEWASTINIPLLEHLLLNRWVTTSKVIERLYVWLRAVSREGEASNRSQFLIVEELLSNLLVVLEIKTNTGQVNKRLHASFAELLWITDTRALEN